MLPTHCAAYTPSSLPPSLTPSLPLQSSPIHPSRLPYPQVVPTAAGPISDRIPASSRPCVSRVTHFWTDTKNPTLHRQLTSLCSHHSMCMCMCMCMCVCVCVCVREREALRTQHESHRKCLKGSMGQIGDGAEWTRILKRNAKIFYSREIIHR